MTTAKRSTEWTSDGPRPTNAALAAMMGRQPDGAVARARPRWLEDPGLFYGPGGPCEWFEVTYGWTVERASFLDLGLPMHARTYRTWVDYHLPSDRETCRWARGEGGTMMAADAGAFLEAHLAFAADGAQS